jgi:hypothetical protein
VLPEGVACTESNWESVLPAVELMRNPHVEGDAQHWHRLYLSRPASQYIQAVEAAAGAAAGGARSGASARAPPVERSVAALRLWLRQVCRHRDTSEGYPGAAGRPFALMPPIWLTIYADRLTTRPWQCAML